MASSASSDSGGAAAAAAASPSLEPHDPDERAHNLDGAWNEEDMKKEMRTVSTVAEFVSAVVEMSASAERGDAPGARRCADVSGYGGSVFVYILPLNMIVQARAYIDTDCSRRYFPSTLGRPIEAGEIDPKLLRDDRAGAGNGRAQQPSRSRRRQANRRDIRAPPSVDGNASGGADSDDDEDALEEDLIAAAAVSAASSQEFEAALPSINTAKDNRSTDRFIVIYHLKVHRDHQLRGNCTRFLRSFARNQEVLDSLRASVVEAVFLERFDESPSMRRMLSDPSRGLGHFVLQRFYALGDYVLTVPPK